MNVDTDTDTTLDLTEAEAAAIEAGKADDAAVVAAAAAPAAAPEPEPEPAAPDPVAAAIAENTAATRALAEQVAAQRQPEPVPEAAPEAPRDYEAELAAAEAALKEAEDKYDEGDMDKAEYDKAKAEFRATERTLIRDQARADAAAEAKRVADELAAATAKAAEERAEADWKAAQDRFFADPGNAKLAESNIKKAAFRAAVQEAFDEGKGTLSFDEVLVKAREKITGIPAVDAQKKVRDAAFERNRDAATPAQTLRDVPAADNPDTAPGAALDNLDISALEDALFKMSDADRARYLADAPGGLRDNPRTA